LFLSFRLCNGQMSGGRSRWGNLDLGDSKSWQRGPLVGSPQLFVNSILWASTNHLRSMLPDLISVEGFPPPFPLAVEIVGQDPRPRYMGRGRGSSPLYQRSPWIDLKTTAPHRLPPVLRVGKSGGTQSGRGETITPLLTLLRRGLLLMLKKRAGLSIVQQKKYLNNPYRKRGSRPDLLNSDVLALLAFGYQKSSICRILGVGISTLLLIEQGKRKQPIPKPKAKDLCTACGCRPKYKGNHFLCEPCYKGYNGGSSEEPTWDVSAACRVR
jgi:hypothetical protein